MNPYCLLEPWGCLLLVLFVSLSKTIQGEKLNDFVLHYEPVQYSQFPIVKELHDGLELPVITLRSFGRTFYLQLTVGSNILSANARIEVRGKHKTHQLTTDHIRHFLVEGKVKDDDSSFVHGCLYGDAFDGVIETSKESYFVESARTYFNHSMPFKSIMYRRSDINSTAVACTSSRNCSQSEADNMMGPILDGSNPGFVNLLPSVGQLRPSIPRNCVCTLKVMVDHTYYEKVGDKFVPKVIADVVFYVHEANKVFSNTDFDNDGSPDDIGFRIMDIVVWQSEDDPNYYLNKDGIHHRSLLLDYVSKYDFSSFCIGLVIVCRIFPGAVLGVSLTASPEYNVIGGICQQLYGGQSYNTVLMTVLSARGLVPRNVILNTITHEIGHAFGSDHDPNTKECSPSESSGGKYLMSFQSLPGNFPNNWRFSPCSKRTMRKVLEEKGRCLIPRSQIVDAVCGNGIQEPGEECDCGDAARCSSVDKCCTPKGGDSTDQECTIHRVKGFNCSPRMLPGECCKDNCTVVTKMEQQKCNKNVACLQESICTGSSAHCPRIPVPNGSPCHKHSGTCSNGACMQDICGDLSLEPCVCTAHDQECAICCTDHTGRRPCQPASLSMTPVLQEQMPDLVKPKGTSCSSGKGICEEGICKVTEIEESGPGIWFYVVMGLICTTLIILLTFVFIYRQRFLPCIFSETSFDSQHAGSTCCSCCSR